MMKIHFIGIGGIGMSGLAKILTVRGDAISGSDLAACTFPGAKLGHDAANVPAGAEVVVSTAIPADNPELARARESGLRMTHRGDLLAEVAALKQSIAVAGAHGKTTTAAMTAHVLRETGRDPAFLIGGELRAARSNAAWGEGDWVVVQCRGRVTTKSGAPYNNTYCYVCRLAGGKLHELIEYCDTQLIATALDPPQAR